MKKYIFVALAVAFYVVGSGSVHAAVPADYGLHEGDLISASGSSDPDVYIVNNQGYKRLFLNERIFSFYGHLGGFENVKRVTPAQRDAFSTSGYFRNCEINDPRVYGIEVTGEDVANLRWVNTTGAQAVQDDSYFFNKVFCINQREFNWYNQGQSYGSVREVPLYARPADVYNKFPVISSVSGPNTLAVGASGTWSVIAYDKEGQTLTYSVLWGDENYPTTDYVPSMGMNAQTTTFTHSYATAGKYKVSFTVKDSDGNVAYSSITVQVGSVIGNSPITVTSPNGGETWTKGVTQTIKWQDISPVPLYECPVGANCVPPAPTSYDIKLAPYYPPCNTNAPCPLYAYRAPYTIVSNVYGSSYNWLVAHTIDIAIGNAPDGSYTVQVCKAGTAVCDSSDSYFKIVSAPTTGPMQVLSPNGGEAWPVGGNKTITWMVNGSVPRVDISLVPHPVYCITTPCPQPAPYSIDRSVFSSSANTYQWQVGYVINSANNGFEYAPDGLYQVQVCVVDGSTCDSSDSYFRIDRYTTY